MLDFQRHVQLYRSHYTQYTSLPSAEFLLSRQRDEIAERSGKSGICSRHLSRIPGGLVVERWIGTCRDVKVVHGWRRYLESYWMFQLSPHESDYDRQCELYDSVLVVA